MAGLANIADIDPWLEPHRGQLADLQGYIDNKSTEILDGAELADFALGHLHFGLHPTKDGWVFREWAPNAVKIYLVSDKTDWQDDESYQLDAKQHGQWELKLPKTAIALTATSTNYTSTGGAGQPLAGKRRGYIPAFCLEVGASLVV